MRTLMMNTFLCIALACFGSFIRGCCSAKLPEPAHPGPLAGWKESQEGGVHTVGTLVLKEGESSDNGKIGVKVVDITAANPCAEYGSLQSLPRVKMQFYKAPQQTVICEELLTAGSGTSLIAGPCGENIADLGVTTISVNAINATEGWVWFELRK
ncbi:MAG TPA: hypothetical protein VJ023_18825 [Pyrinomonadaceae bacterium]|nr:hypothetical protein [Pyrinomonadaceae bacterium]